MLFVIFAVWVLVAMTFLFVQGAREVDRFIEVVRELAEKGDDEDEE